MRNSDLSVVVAAAVAGDRRGWDELVRRFGGLVWATARSFRLTHQDVEDVSQTVWLQLATHIRSLREPAALPGWLATATRREGLRVANRTRRDAPLYPDPRGDDPPDRVSPLPEELVLREERRRQVRAAFERLGERCRQLLSLLAADPPVTYAVVSKVLEMPLGGVGPTRARCLEQLRRYLG
jgi:RNA polymerase sigma factor (sigma-70 family)